MSEPPLVWGRQKGVTPICFDLLRFLPICSDLRSLLSGMPRFVPICSDSFRFVLICFQNKSEQIRETTFCRPLLQVREYGLTGLSADFTRKCSFALLRLHTFRTPKSLLSPRPSLTVDCKTNPDVPQEIPDFPRSSLGLPRTYFTKGKNLAHCAYRSLHLGGIYTNPF